MEEDHADGNLQEFGHHGTAVHMVYAPMTSMDNTVACRLASLLQLTNRQKLVPVAIHLMPPSLFWRAVMEVSMKHWLTSLGTLALAKISAADVKSSSVSVSSKHTLRISLVQLPRPGKLPVGAVRKHFSTCSNPRPEGERGSTLGNQYIERDGDT